MGASEITTNNKSETWKVLIADDYPETHSVIECALLDLIVLDRRLEYIHAYSEQNACQLINDNPDIVLVFVNVEMDSETAGLNVVKYIRDTLCRQDIRIVLRTDQLEYSIEESVIKDYDINDYQTKADLTRRKLMTTVYTAIRSFQQIFAVNENRRGLEKIISASSEVIELGSIQDYAQGVLTEFIQLFDDDLVSGLFCSKGSGLVDAVGDLSFDILGQIGFSSVLSNEKLDNLKNQQASQLITKCFQDKKNQFTDNDIALYFTRGEYQAALYFKINSQLSETNKQLIEVFLMNIAIGYENVHLFQKLSHAAYQCWLTELPNRLEFVNRLNEFSQSDNNNSVAALIDLNHFSDINDGLGQEVGNQLLVAVAKRLGQLSGNCQLARVGADVFGIIGPSETINSAKISELFNLPLVAGEQILPINICIGFCTKEHAVIGGVKVLNQINIALNLAKNTPEETYFYYRKEMEDETLWRLGMIRQLRTDFSKNRLELWYQPQLNLATGDVIGAEALLRWRNADGKFISPAVFIPLAEYSGLIIEIGDWVINQACVQINKLEALGYNHVGISVNVSIPQFRRGDFVEKIIQATQLHQVEPSKLELEITESILMDQPQIVIDALVKLKEHGVSIALDDFGTGYSSLSYLQKFPLDRLKVDRTFVTDINQDGNSFIAETIITLGKQMNLKVIAEGIETLEQQERLIELGCDEVQGFYYARPLPLDEFLVFIANN
ncbi:MAG: diguanylate cyclase (GGDEF)-like protein [Alteromonadaceae bacterium]|jgi:diguanylate cyclase (GGDEF)-like protein|tara:strand:+ start:1344 stop:3521 length:2178 start_codon:yes stop_codon:yes gene_type:complete